MCIMAIGHKFLGLGLIISDCTSMGLNSRVDHGYPNLFTDSFHFLPSELLVKQLVPLGFKRSDIHKVSESGQDSLKLMTQQEEGDLVSSDEEVEKDKEKKEGGDKVFAIECVQVSYIIVCS